jgi:superfamily I DNA/RNA helicase
MTVHQAKGKEVDAVILVNAGARQFADSDDDRRLSYVAMTRALKRWLVVAPARDALPLLRSL